MIGAHTGQSGFPVSLGIPLKNTLKVVKSEMELMGRFALVFFLSLPHPLKKKKQSKTQKQGGLSKPENGQLVDFPLFNHCDFRKTGQKVPGNNGKLPVEDLAVSVPLSSLVQTTQKLDTLK